MNDFIKKENKKKEKKKLKKEIKKKIIIDNNNNNNGNNNGSINSNNNGDIKNHTDLLDSAFKESITKNKWFYLTICICFFIFRHYGGTSSSYITFAFSFIFILAMGHITHRLSHNLHFLDIYNRHKKSNINGRVDTILTKVFNLLDFHRITHHDTSINKELANIRYEFLNNFLTQGGGLILFIWFYNRFIDTRVVLLWALMYATAHNINYLFIKPTVHRDHHLNEDTNFGLDIADIIFDTKYDLNDIEDHNHISINLILITLIIAYFTHFIQKL